MKYSMRGSSSRRVTLPSSDSYRCPTTSHPGGRSNAVFQRIQRMHDDGPCPNQAIALAGAATVACVAWGGGIGCVCVCKVQRLKQGRGLELCSESTALLLALSRLFELERCSRPQLTTHRHRACDPIKMSALALLAACGASASSTSKSHRSGPASCEPLCLAFDRAPSAEDRKATTSERRSSELEVKEMKLLHSSSLKRSLSFLSLLALGGAREEAGGTHACSHLTLTHTPPKPLGFAPTTGRSIDLGGRMGCVTHGSRRPRVAFKCARRPSICLGG